MAKISKKTINNLREFLSRGCDYAGTQEQVDEITTEILRGLKSESYGDERIGWNNTFLVIIENIPYGFVTFDKVKDGTMFNSRGEEYNET